MNNYVYTNNFINNVDINILEIILGANMGNSIKSSTSIINDLIINDSSNNNSSNYNSILIKNATLINDLTNNKLANSHKTNKTDAITTKSDILIESNEVAEISSKINVTGVDKVIDATGKILMPGLVNTHTHTPMNLLRGVGDDLLLDDWLNNHIWPLEANLNQNYTYTGTLLACCEMIKSGTTCFNDMYFFMEGVAKAVEETGIRAILSHGMIDFDDGEKRKAELRKSKKLIKNVHNSANGRIKIAFGPHAPYTASKELLQEVRTLASKMDIIIHIHVSETQKEVDNCLELNSIRPFEYLSDIGFLGDDVLAAHAVHLSDNEINIIKENNTKIAHNPCSNMKLSSGIAPLSKLIENNICVSLATDGAASNNNLDLIEEMKFASLLQKVANNNPETIPAPMALKLATINGAAALGLENEIGSIEVGKKADLILIDLNKLNTIPVSHPASNIVYSANGSNVDTTICNGKILMENRKLTTINEKILLTESGKIANKLINS